MWDSGGDQSAQGRDDGEGFLWPSAKYHQLDLEGDTWKHLVSLEMFPSLSEHLPQPLTPQKGISSSDPDPAGSILCSTASVQSSLGYHSMLGLLIPPPAQGPMGNMGRWRHGRAGDVRGGIGRDQMGADLGWKLLQILVFT